MSYFFLPFKKSSVFALINSLKRFFLQTEKNQHISLQLTFTAFCLYLSSRRDPPTHFARDNDDFKDDDDDFLFSFISSDDDYVQRGFGFFFDDIIIF